MMKWSDIRKNETALKSVSLFTGINFFAKAVSFLLILIYTQPRYMTPEENGLLNLFNSGLVFLTPFMSMGLIQSTTTEFFRLDKKEFNNYFTTALCIPM